MDIKHGTRFFLGANSPEGFCSLFGDFVSVGDGDFLWVIKGGPGCGKSGFMKKIGKAAEERGYSVEYIACSLEPESMDGVYIPELHVGYVDGSAPHVVETYNVGAASSYLDLGAYYDIEGLRGKLPELLELEGRYAQEIERMRTLLSAAGAVNPRNLPELCSAESCNLAVRRVSGVVSREFGKGGRGKEGARAKRRFISTFTADGELFLEETVNSLCKKVYTLDNDFGLAPAYLDKVEAEALARGYSPIACPNPMEPKQLESVLIPELSLGFISISSRRRYSGAVYRHVRLDVLLPAELVRELRPRYRAAARMYNEILNLAGESMVQARSIHDEMEALYNPHVEFGAIDALAEKHLKMLLG